MIPQDDIEDIQELTQKIVEYILILLQDQDDELVQKNVLCSVFANLIYVYFPRSFQVEQLFIRILECIEILGNIKKH